MTEQPHTDGYTIVTEYRIHDEEWCALIYKGTGPDAADLRSNYQASKYGKTEQEAVKRAQAWIDAEQVEGPRGHTYRTNVFGDLLLNAPDPATAA